MKRKIKSSGSTPASLAIPGLEAWLSSAEQEGSRRGLGKNTYDPTWDSGARE